MTSSKELVLVGGGHAHVQVLRSLLMAPLRDVHVTVVVDRPVAVYSGMVPGAIAGQYGRSELELDVRPLARRAGAAVVHARATAIDPVEKTLALEGRAPIRWDVASLNVGSTVASLDVPGAREHAVATRPIGRFVARFDELVRAARSRAGEPCRVVVVGGGAAGVELSFAVRERLSREGVSRASVTLVDRSDTLLPGRGEAVAQRVLDRARARGIEVLLGVRVLGLDASRLELEGRPPVEHDVVLWATGAGAPAFLGASGLATDARGFVWVRPTLQVKGHDDLFAAGDCAVLETWPEIPKAGVYAVREGPVLAENLRARLAGRPLVPYVPQRDHLALLNLGDGTAIGTKWGLTVEGRWVFRLKDRIDRRFVERFRVLGETGVPELTFEQGLPPMPSRTMICGGCAAKVGEPALRRALARLAPRSDADVVLGLERPDDVAAIRHQGELLVTTIDAFTAFTDDPWLVGRVAAINALSDLEAKSVAPRFALAIVTVPRGSNEEETLYQVLAGARETLGTAGVTLVGGHTTTGTELLVGFAVTGFASDEKAILTKGGLRPGDRLVLTRALGTGVLFHADMKGLAKGPWIDDALRRMVRGNREAGQIARAAGARAATDVTGFGLAGHLGEMLRASGVSAEIDSRALPALPGALELLSRGMRSTSHAQNREARKGLQVTGDAERAPTFELLFDPQTAGGLLFGIDAARADEVVAKLRAADDTTATVIGQVTPLREDQAAFLVR